MAKKVMPMRVEFEFDGRGWLMTPRVSEQFKLVKDQEGYLRESLVAIQSKINVMVRNGTIGDDAKKAHIIVEGERDMAGEQIAVAGVCLVVDKIMNQFMKVRIELHIMMQDEYISYEDTMEDAIT